MADKEQEQVAATEADDTGVEAVSRDSEPGGAAARASTDAAADAEGTEPVTDGEPQSAFAAELEQLNEELAAAKDQALRAQADALNAKRRAEQDVEKARKYALERFSGELLPVVDNLERALESAGGDDDLIKPIAEGVELTLKSLLDVLRKFQIEPLDPVGEPFDPQLHQAMSIIENPDAEPNTVLSVLQKGYTLNGRLIRPAMVMVSKAPA